MVVLEFELRGYDTWLMDASGHKGGAKGGSAEESCAHGRGEEKRRKPTAGLRSVDVRHDGRGYPKIKVRRATYFAQALAAVVEGMRWSTRAIVFEGPGTVGSPQLGS